MLLFIEQSPTQWILNKKGGINSITISMNKLETSGYIKTYLEPLMLNNSLSIRLCCVFEISHSIRPYLIQMDIFSSKITITIMESHLLMIMEILNSIEKCKSVYDIKNYDENMKSNHSISSKSSKFKKMLAYSDIKLNITN